VSQLSAGAFRVWFAGICYSKEHLTDGRLPRELDKLAKALGVEVTQAFVDELLAVKENEKNLFQKRRKKRGNPLWKCRKMCIQIHDWFDWQDSKREIQAQRKKTRARVKAHREKRLEPARNAVTGNHVTPLHLNTPDRPVSGSRRKTVGISSEKRRKNVANPVHKSSSFRTGKSQKAKSSGSDGSEGHGSKRTGERTCLGVTPLPDVTPLQDPRNAVTSSPVTPYTPDPGSGIRVRTYVQRVPLARHDSPAGQKPASTFQRLSVIVRELLKTRDYRYDGGEADLAEDLKRAAARQDVTWTDPREITKAIESEQFKAHRRRPA
jgi:hypothetical protein